MNSRYLLFTLFLISVAQGAQQLDDQIKQQAFDLEKLTGMIKGAAKSLAADGKAAIEAQSNQITVMVTRAKKGSKLSEVQSPLALFTENINVQQLKDYGHTYLPEDLAKTDFDLIIDWWADPDDTQKNIDDAWQKTQFLKDRIEQYEGLFFKTPKEHKPVTFSGSTHLPGQPDGMKITLYYWDASEPSSVAAYWSKDRRYSYWWAKVEYRGAAFGWSPDGAVWGFAPGVVTEPFGSKDGIQIVWQNGVWWDETGVIGPDGQAEVDKRGPIKISQKLFNHHKTKSPATLSAAWSPLELFTTGGLFESVENSSGGIGRINGAVQAELRLALARLDWFSILTQLVDPDSSGGWRTVGLESFRKNLDDKRRKRRLAIDEIVFDKTNSLDGQPNGMVIRLGYYTPRESDGCWVIIFEYKDEQFFYFPTGEVAKNTPTGPIFVQWDDTASKWVNSLQRWSMLTRKLGMIPSPLWLFLPRPSEQEFRDDILSRIRNVLTELLKLTTKKIAELPQFVVDDVSAIAAYCQQGFPNDTKLIDVAKKTYDESFKKTIDGRKTVDDRNYDEGQVDIVVGRNKFVFSEENKNALPGQLNGMTVSLEYYKEDTATPGYWWLRVQYGDEIFGWSPNGEIYQRKVGNWFSERFLREEWDLVQWNSEAWEWKKIKEPSAKELAAKAVTDSAATKLLSQVPSPFSLFTKDKDLEFIQNAGTHKDLARFDWKTITTYWEAAVSKRMDKATALGEWLASCKINAKRKDVTDKSQQQNVVLSGLKGQPAGMTIMLKYVRRADSICYWWAYVSYKGEHFGYSPNGRVYRINENLQWDEIEWDEAKAAWDYPLDLGLWWSVATGEMSEASAKKLSPYTGSIAVDKINDLPDDSVPGPAPVTSQAAAVSPEKVRVSFFAKLLSRLKRAPKVAQKLTEVQSPLELFIEGECKGKKLKDKSAIVKNNGISRLLTIGSGAIGVTSAVTDWQTIVMRWGGDTKEALKAWQASKNEDQAGRSIKVEDLYAGRYGWFLKALFISDENGLPGQPKDMEIALAYEPPTDNNLGYWKVTVRYGDEILIFSPDGKTYRFDVASKMAIPVEWVQKKWQDVKPSSAAALGAAPSQVATSVPIVPEEIAESELLLEHPAERELFAGIAETWEAKESRQGAYLGKEAVLGQSLWSQLRSQWKKLWPGTEVQRNKEMLAKGLGAVPVAEDVAQQQSWWSSWIAKIKSKIRPVPKLLQSPLVGKMPTSSRGYLSKLQSPLLVFTSVNSDKIKSAVASVQADFAAQDWQDVINNWVILSGDPQKLPATSVWWQQQALNKARTSLPSAPQDIVFQNGKVPGQPNDMQISLKYYPATDADFQDTGIGYWWVELQYNGETFGYDPDGAVYTFNGPSWVEVKWNADKGEWVSTGPGVLSRLTSRLKSWLKSLRKPSPTVLQFIKNAAPSTVKKLEEVPSPLALLDEKIGKALIDAINQKIKKNDFATFDWETILNYWQNSYQYSYKTAVAWQERADKDRVRHSSKSDGSDITIDFKGKPDGLGCALRYYPATAPDELGYWWVEVGWYRETFGYTPDGFAYKYLADKNDWDELIWSSEKLGWVSTSGLTDETLNKLFLEQEREEPESVGGPRQPVSPLQGTSKPAVVEQPSPVSPQAVAIAVTEKPWPLLCQTLGLMWEAVRDEALVQAWAQTIWERNSATRLQKYPLLYAILNVLQEPGPAWRQSVTASLNDRSRDQARRSVTVHTEDFPAGIWPHDIQEQMTLSWDWRENQWKLSIAGEGEVPAPVEKMAGRDAAPNVVMTRKKLPQVALALPRPVEVPSPLQWFNPRPSVDELGSAFWQKYGTQVPPFAYDDWVAIVQYWAGQEAAAKATYTKSVDDTEGSRKRTLSDLNKVMNKKYISTITLNDANPLSPRVTNVGKNAQQPTGMVIVFEYVEPLGDEVGYWAATVAYQGKAYRYQPNGWKTDVTLSWPWSGPDEAAALRAKKKFAATLEPIVEELEPRWVQNEPLESREVAPQKLETIPAFSLPQLLPITEEGWLRSVPSPLALFSPQPDPQKTTAQAGFVDPVIMAVKSDARLLPQFWMDDWKVITEYWLADIDARLAKGRRGLASIGYESSLRSTRGSRLTIKELEQLGFKLVTLFIGLPGAPKILVGQPDNMLITLKYIKPTDTPGFWFAEVRYDHAEDNTTEIFRYYPDGRVLIRDDESGGWVSSVWNLRKKQWDPVPEPPQSEESLNVGEWLGVAEGEGVESSIATVPSSQKQPQVLATDGHGEFIQVGPRAPTKKKRETETDQVTITNLGTGTRTSARVPSGREMEDPVIIQQQTIPAAQPTTSLPATVKGSPRTKAQASEDQDTEIIDLTDAPIARSQANAVFQVPVTPTDKNVEEGGGELPEAEAPVQREGWARQGAAPKPLATVSSPLIFAKFPQRPSVDDLVKKISAKGVLQSALADCEAIFTYWDRWINLNFDDASPRKIHDNSVKFTPEPREKTAKELKFEEVIFDAKNKLYTDQPDDMNISIYYVKETNKPGYWAIGVQRQGDDFFEYRPTGEVYKGSDKALLTQVSWNDDAQRWQEVKSTPAIVESIKTVAKPAVSTVSVAPVAVSKAPVVKPIVSTASASAQTGLQTLTVTRSPLVLFFPRPFVQDLVKKVREQGVIQFGCDDCETIFTYWDHWADENFNDSLRTIPDEPARYTTVNKLKDKAAITFDGVKNPIASSQPKGMIIDLKFKEVKSGTGYWKIGVTYKNEFFMYVPTGVVYRGSTTDKTALKQVRWVSRAKEWQEVSGPAPQKPAVQETSQSSVISSAQLAALSPKKLSGEIPSPLDFLNPRPKELTSLYNLINGRTDLPAFAKSDWLMIVDCWGRENQDPIARDTMAKRIFGQKSSVLSEAFEFEGNDPRKLKLTEIADPSQNNMNTQYITSYEVALPGLPENMIVTFRYDEPANNNGIGRWVAEVEDSSTGGTVIYHPDGTAYQTGVGLAKLLQIPTKEAVIAKPQKEPEKPVQSKTTASEAGAPSKSTIAKKETALTVAKPKSTEAVSLTGSSNKVATVSSAQTQAIRSLSAPQPLSPEEQALKDAREDEDLEVGFEAPAKASVQRVSPPLSLFIPPIITENQINALLNTINTRCQNKLVNTEEIKILLYRLAGNQRQANSDYRVFKPRPESGCTLITFDKRNKLFAGQPDNMSITFQYHKATQLYDDGDPFQNDTVSYWMAHVFVTGKNRVTYYSYSNQTS